jgi:hypothetical protein
LDNDAKILIKKYMNHIIPREQFFRLQFLSSTDSPMHGVFLPLLSSPAWQERDLRAIPLEHVLEQELQVVHSIQVGS